MQIGAISTIYVTVTEVLKCKCDKNTVVDVFYNNADLTHYR